MTMRLALRAALTLAAILVALSLGLAMPAAAAPPPTTTELYFTSGTVQCVDQAGGTFRCTETTLNVIPEIGEPPTPCLVITKYVYNTADGEQVSQTYETGCAVVDSATFSVTDRIEVTLQPTQITVAAPDTCDPEGIVCSPGATRTVTVSASDTPTGPIRTTRAWSVTRDGDCTFRERVTYTEASVAGTLTIDGVAYDEEGSASKLERRVVGTC
jgi:hypothetical protein